MRIKAFSLTTEGKLNIGFQGYTARQRQVDLDLVNSGSAGRPGKQANFGTL